MKEDQ